MWFLLYKRWANIFLNHMNHLAEILMLNLICLIMQQKQASKTFRMLILWVLRLASLKTEVDKLDIDESKILPNNLSNLKSKVDKLDIDKLTPVPVNLSRLSNVVKN